jgi:hypothetical protein
VDVLLNKEGGMTEAEWLVSVSPRKMIAALNGKGSDRLWRLFAVACAHRVERQMRDDRSRKALEVAERFADGAATKEELRVARVHAEEAVQQARYDEYMDEERAKFRWDDEYQAVYEARCAAEAVLQCVAEDIGNKPGGQVAVIAERFQLPDLLREIFGNPFRWTIIDPLWLSRNDRAVVKLAEWIYDERAFSRLPILADALEDAGCGDTEILSHCRVTGDHVRGCWVLDLVLEKE